MPVRRRGGPHCCESHLILLNGSRQSLKEFGWMENAKGTGVDRKGSGYSLI